MNPVSQFVSRGLVAGFSLLAALPLLNGCERESRQPFAGDRLPKNALLTNAAAVDPAQAPDVTPKIDVPAVAEQLTAAFAGAADAIRPSVVRIDVVSGAPNPGLTRGVARVPDPTLIPRSTSSSGHAARAEWWPAEERACCSRSGGPASCPRGRTLHSPD
jgi:hypothetical protein